MSYESTAARKRPQQFDQLAGQEFIGETLKKSLTSGRIAHAYLFSGPRGVGKTSAARILSKALNCQDGPTGTPCGVCEHCTSIQAGNALDVMEIDGASNTGVNDVREIKEEILFSPNTAKYKIYIIDEVHMLSISAFNALLKTIEEPPPYIVFIFATTEIHKVPATIRSRCQQFSFRLISSKAIIQLLETACEETDITAEHEALFWIAKESQGSLRDAYTIFDQVVALSDGEITLQKIQDTLGFVGIDQMNRIAESMADKNAREILDFLDNLLTSGISVEQVVIDLAEYFRSVLFIKTGIEREDLLGYPRQFFSDKAVNSFSDYQLEWAVEELLSLYKELRFSLNQRYEVELTLTKFSRISEVVSQTELIRKIQNLKSEISELPFVSTETPQENPASADTNNGPPASYSFSEHSPSQPEQGSQHSAEDENKNSYATQHNSGGEQYNNQGGNETGHTGTNNFPGEAVKDESEENSPPQRGEPAFLNTEATASSELQEASASEGNTENILEKLSEKLQKRKLSLAAALDKAVHCSLKDDGIHIWFNHQYPANFVRDHKQMLMETAEDILGRKAVVHIQLQEDDASDGTSKKKLDSDIDLIKRVFRGEIVQGEEK